MRRKLILKIILVLCVCIIIIIIKYNVSNQDILLSTYEQLDELEKKEVSNYKNGEISIVLIPNESVNDRTFYYDSSYKGEKVYLVTFFTNNSTIGDIEKLLDFETKKIIGYNLRD